MSLNQSNLNIMKKHPIPNLMTFVLVLLAFQFASCQTRVLTDSPTQNPFTITMTVDSEKWKTDRYEAITFSDREHPGGGIKGRKFSSKVGPQQLIKWEAKITNAGTKDLEVVLITVFRDPVKGGGHVLAAPWYDSRNGGQHIIGWTRNFVLGDENEGEELKEHYLISFAITDKKGRYDIFTVDPFLIGHDR